MSQIAYVGCGQGVALVPASMRRLASENIVFRPLKERVMVVTAALAWNTNRHHPMVDAVVSWAKSVGGRVATPKLCRRRRAEPCLAAAGMLATNETGNPVPHLHRVRVHREVPRPGDSRQRYACFLEMRKVGKVRILLTVHEHLLA